MAVGQHGKYLAIRNELIMNFFDAVKNIEKSNDLLKIRHRNLFIWPIIRYQFLSLIFFQKIKSDGFVIRKSSYLKYISNTIYSLIRFPRINVYTRILVFTSPDSLVYDNEKKIYKNRVFDNYLNSLNINQITYIEDLLNVNVFDFKIYRKNHFSFYSVKIIIEFFTLFFRIFYTKKYKIISNKIELIENITCQSFKKIDKSISNKIKNSSTKTIIRSQFWYQYFHYLLKNKFIKTIFIEDAHYGLEKSILCFVASELKIKTIEIQHGFIFKNHIAYNHFHLNYSPVEYRNYFPNYFFTYSSFWKSQTNLFSKIEIIGTPEYKNAIKVNLQKEKKILIISNGADYNEMIEFINNIFNDKRLLNYDIYIRPHPHEINNFNRKYTHLLNSRIFLDTEKLEKSLSTSEIIISVLSTVLFQALFYCKKVFILNTNFTKGYLNSDFKYIDIIEINKYEKIFEKSNKENDIINYYWLKYDSNKFLKLVNL